MIACVSLVVAATTAGLAASPTPKPHAAALRPSAKVAAHKRPAKCRVAPADEYFGKLKMSILGIRNVIKDQGLKVDYAPDNAPSTFGAMALAEDALHDWEHKYPCDTWLPGTIFALEHFYLKIHTDIGVRRVHATYAWLRHDYPKSKIVRLAREEDGEAVIATPPPDPALATPAPLVPVPSVSVVPAPAPH
jgi:hypothetical protein